MALIIEIIKEACFVNYLKSNSLRKLSDIDAIEIQVAAIIICRSGIIFGFDEV